MRVSAPGSATSNGKRISHNVSLDPIESAAMRRLAEEEDRGVIAWFIQRLIDERMRSKIGSDWREQIAADLSRDSLLS